MQNNPFFDQGTILRVVYVYVYYQIIYLSYFQPL